MTAAPALLVIAHGTREPRGAAEMDVLVDLLRARHAGPVVHAWLEDFAEPGVAEVVARLAGEGAEMIVSVPFLNFGAGHAKTDIPRLLAEARARHPDVGWRHARVLGLHPALFQVARGRVAAVSDPRSGREALVVTASGSSDPDANADLAKAARFLAEGSGHRWVEHAFAGVTWPLVEVVVRRIAAAGAVRAVLFSWSLLAGRLERSVSRTAVRVGRDCGLEVRDAGRLGPEPSIADAVMDRYREALAGDARMNCDLCAYRVPLPGLEDRVAAPSGGGTGQRVATPPPLA